MKKLLFTLLMVISALSANAQSGYRGFADVNFIAGCDGVWSGFNTIGGGVSTTHGYQFNPYVFLGGGVRFQYHNFDNFDNSCSLPIYAAFRVNMMNRNVSPFADVKLGYSVADITGLYFSPSFGVRIKMSDKIALTPSIGYSLQGDDYEESIFHYSRYGSYYTHDSQSKYMHCLNLSFGIEF